MFKEPIQFGHQKFIPEFNFCVDLALNMVHLAIFPYDKLNSREFGCLIFLKIPLGLP
jgi:hypothetical protein